MLKGKFLERFFEDSMSVACVLPYLVMINIFIYSKTFLCFWIGVLAYFILTTAICFIRKSYKGVTYKYAMAYSILSHINSDKEICKINAIIEMREKFLIGNIPAYERELEIFNYLPYGTVKINYFREINDN